MVTGARRTDRVVVDLRRYALRRLAQRLEPELELGHVFQSASEVDNVADWRAAVRKVGRERGWRVRTGATTDGERLWAVREDLELTPESRAAAVRRFHHAISTTAWHPGPAS